MKFLKYSIIHASSRLPEFVLTNGSANVLLLLYVHVHVYAYATSYVAHGDTLQQGTYVTLKAGAFQ